MSVQGRPFRARALSLVLALVLPAVAAAQNRVPRFEPGDCPMPRGAWATGVRVECGRLVVYEARERPGSRELRLAVAILRASQPSGAPPLVMLHGGPGGVGGLRYWFLSAAAAWPLARHRDIVVYDLRGAGLSEPTLCPDFDLGGAMRVAASRQQKEENTARARACVRSLRAQGIEPAAYNTATNVADLIDLRHALGYSTWDIYGSSYGSRLAQEAMRRDSHAVHSVVLAGPSIPGPAGQVEIPLTLQSALAHTFATCAEQPECRAAFPTLEQDFNELYDELTAKPLEVPPADTTTGTRDLLGGERLVRALYGQLTSTRDVVRVPLLIHELRLGDRLRAARLLTRGTGGGGTRVLGALVYCYDVYGAALRTAAEAVRSRAPQKFRDFSRDDFDECPEWQQRFADPSEHQLVQSSIPTLILTGEFDPRTPTAHGHRIAAKLSRSYIYEIPGESHAARPSGCHEAILLQFLENPLRAPDASCIRSMPRITFATRSLTVPTLVLVISAGNDSPFAGRWEAEFPNANRLFTVELKADGQRLTGVLDPARDRIPITDGRIDERTISFSIRTPDGERVITFTGALAGDQIEFTRAVDVRAGGQPGGAGIFGAAGARAFTAQRPPQ